MIEILLGKHIKMHNSKKDSRRLADTVTDLPLLVLLTKIGYLHHFGIKMSKIVR